MEAEAVKGILLRINRGEWRGITSGIIDWEVDRIADVGRLAQVILITSGMQERVELGPSDRARASALCGLGFKPMDAMHIACAEKAKADVFLTTDDLLLRVAARCRGHQLKVRVANPLTWYEEVV